MALNERFEIGLDYHEGTKHLGGHLMERSWGYAGERPFLFKEYEGGSRVKLAVDKSAGEMSALQAIAADGMARDGGVPDLSALARILYFSAGITKRIDRGPGRGVIPFRAAACTGALYHIELYVICGDLPGLAAGVYHFDPRKPELVQLRRGDLRGVLAAATGGAQEIVQAPVVIAYSDVYWRNAIKYQAREYRHAFWDCGTILSNSLAVAAAQELPAKVVLGFADEPLNRLLDLDIDEEFVLALLAVGGRRPALPPPAVLPPLEAQTLTRWPRRVKPILEMHRASMLADGQAAAAWRQAALDWHEMTSTTAPGEKWIALPEVGEVAPAMDALEKVILRRGSTRRFARRSIPLEKLAVMLQQATWALAADFGSLDGPALNELYVIASAVEGLATGAYRYHPAAHALEPLRRASEERMRHEAGHLALDQELGADAAANVYFLSDLQPVLSRLGNRGYRAAQLEASITAGRIYLAAYAQGIGATGLTFYDDVVTRFFRRDGMGVMFLVAVGQKEDGISSGA